MYAATKLLRPAALAAAAALSLGASGARAGLFDDDEARKAILDLRVQQQSTDQRVDQLVSANAKLADQIDKLRQGLLDLNSQLETARADNAKLRGAQEQMLRDLADVQRKQIDALQAIDGRLKKLEPQQVSLDGKDFSVEPDEKKAYDGALTALRGGDFDRAAPALQAFIARYPSSGYLDSARFWLGNALYGRKDYKGAIDAFKTLVATSPDSPRAPEAMLAMANCQFEMKDNRGARRTLGELVKNYPKSEAAAAGKERMASIKG